MSNKSKLITFLLLCLVTSSYAGPKSGHLPVAKVASKRKKSYIASTTKTIESEYIKHSSSSKESGNSSIYSEKYETHTIAEVASPIKRVKVKRKQSAQEAWRKASLEEYKDLSMLEVIRSVQEPNSTVGEDLVKLKTIINSRAKSHENFVTEFSSSGEESQNLSDSPKLDKSNSSGYENTISSAKDSQYLAEKEDSQVDETVEHYIPENESSIHQTDSSLNYIVRELNHTSNIVGNTINTIKNLISHSKGNLRYVEEFGISAGSENSDNNASFNYFADLIVSETVQKTTNIANAHKIYNVNYIAGISVDYKNNANLNLAYSISQNTTKFKESGNQEVTTLHTITLQNQNKLGETENHVSDISHSITGGKIFTKNREGKHSGDVLNFSSSYSRTYYNGDNFITPSITLNYDYIYLPSFKGRELEVSKKIERKFSFLPKLNIGKNIKFNGILITPSIYYGLNVNTLHLQKDRIATANKQQYRVPHERGELLDHNTGINLEIAKGNLKSSFSYDINFKRKNYNHGIRLSLSWNF